MLEIFQQHWLQNSQVPIIHRHLPLCQQINGTIRVPWWAPAAPHLQQSMPEGNQSSASKHTRIVPVMRTFTSFQMTLTSANHEWTLLWGTQFLSTGHFRPRGPLCCFRSNTVSHILHAGQLSTKEKFETSLGHVFCFDYWIASQGLDIESLLLDWWWCLGRCWMLWDMVPRC